MKVSRAQALENRERVIDVASRLFRRHGFDGIGIADLMKAAGLTQGAFYKQFASKEDLAAIASARAAASVRERWREFAARDPERPLASLARSYLSPKHRDEHANGCAIAALGADAARAGPAVRAAMENCVEEHVAFLEELLEGDEERRPRAIALGATLIGALVLSRTVNDEALSREILEAAMHDVIARGEPARATGAGSGV